jgi:hypothetical protein
MLKLFILFVLFIGSTYYSTQTLQVKEKNLIPKYFFNRPNALKLSSLFNKKKPETIRKLCKLIDIINKKMSSECSNQYKVNTYHYIIYQHYGCTLNSNYEKNV